MASVHLWVGFAHSPAPEGDTLDKRISTGLLAARDTLAAGLVSAPIVVPLAVFIALRMPPEDPAIPRSEQMLEVAGMALPLGLMLSNLGFLAAGWWFRRHRPVEAWPVNDPRKLDRVAAIPIGIGVGLLGLMASFTIGVFVVLAFGIQQPPDNPLRALANAGGAALVALFLLGTIVAPVGEELFFRGHIFRWSANRCGFRYGYVLSAALFALIHFQPVGMPGYFAIGLIYARAYRRWRTLVVPVVAHATNNAIALGLAVLGSRLAG